MKQNEIQACSLDGTQLAERLEEWGRVTSRAIRRRVDGGRMVADYPKDDALLRRIEELIEAEAECCSFMQFTVTEDAESFTVELRVPDDIAPAIIGALGRSVEEPAPVQV